LVARVETVDANVSQALLITAPSTEARISAIVERQPPNPSPAGLIRGEGPNAITLELADPTATVESGDTVVTAGFSAEIPRGIVIGRVVSVQDDPAFGKRTATVFPRVALGQVREVVVLK
jgi:cell shape-determining protein MreC